MKGKITPQANSPTDGGRYAGGEAAQKAVAKKKTNSNSGQKPAPTVLQGVVTRHRLFTKAMAA
jgi:hypothetical protein